MIPDGPLVSVIYRGFLLSPNSDLNETLLERVEYQFASSTDDSIYTDWQELAVAFGASNFNFIHDALYTDVYYRYRLRAYFLDGTISEWSDYTLPGNGTLVPADEINVQSLDQLASSLGTITSGFLRGVVFETSANYPKVRMDPSGFYAITASATPLSINASTGAINLLGNITVGSTVPSRTLAGSTGGYNLLPNARFDYWPSGDSPWGWQHYDHGGTGTATWTQLAGQGPSGTNAWRVVTSGISVSKGFMTSSTKIIKPNTTYVFSWYARGTVQPSIAANTTFNNISEWVLNPTISSGTWQRYAYRVNAASGGGLAATPLYQDYFYVYGGISSHTLEIALPQMEEGDAVTAHGPTPDEVLPGTIGATQITPNSITTQQLSATAINGMTITGATIQTATPSGARVALQGSTNSFDVYDSTPTNVVRIDGSVGVDLLAGTTFSGENMRAVSWRQSIPSGNETGRVKSYTGAGSINATEVASFKIDSSHYAYSYMTGRDETGAAQSTITVAAGPTTSANYINLGITGYTPGVYVATNKVTIHGAVELDSGSLTLAGTALIMNGSSTVIDGDAGWHRAYGNGKGFYCAYGGGGIYMTDSTYIRTYGGKQFYCDNIIWSASELLTSAGVRDPTQSNLYLRGGTTNNVVCQNGAGTNCDIWYATAHSSSDLRLKKKIRPIADALAKVHDLHGITHEWKKGKGPEGRKFGFIAQEVQKVAPELVAKGDDDMLSVDYEHAIPILVEAIKELSERVETLTRAASGS